MQAKLCIGLLGLLCLTGALAQATDKIVFGVIGDWGRSGGYGAGQNCATVDNSTKNPLENCVGAPYQKALAKVLNDACGTAKCEFIINTGDNFYNNSDLAFKTPGLGACTADNAPTDPKYWCSNRFKTDFEDIYQTSATPNIANLTWYGVLGNHDIIGNAGQVDALISYGSKNTRWQIGRWYGRDFTKGSLSIRFTFLDSSPFVSKYLTNASQYNSDEVKNFSSPGNVDAQLSFAESSLNSSKATWDTMVVHHPMYGAATQYATDDAKSPGFPRLLKALQKYNPVAYFNGHDHFLTAATGGNGRTQYYTVGAGSFIDNVTPPLANSVQFNSALTKYNDPNAAPGIAIVTVTSTTYKVEFFTIRGAAASKPVFTSTSTIASKGNFTVTLDTATA